MVKNIITSSDREYIKNLAFQITNALSGTDAEVHQKSAMVSGQLSYAVEIIYGKHNANDTDISLNLNTGFGSVNKKGEIV